MKTFIAAILMLVICTLFADAVSIRRARGSIKFDSSRLRKRQTNDDEPIYGNNIPGSQAKIADQYFELQPNVSYNFGYLQTDLQRRQEEATFKEDPENQQYVIEKVSGYYKYVRPDGKWQRVDYEADENGFRPIVVVSDDEPIIDESVIELAENREKNIENGETTEQSEILKKRL